MNAPESLDALRRANPRARAGFARSAAATADALRAQLATSTAEALAEAPASRSRHPRARLIRTGAAGVALAAAAAVTAFVLVASPVAGPGATSAAAAVRSAAATTARSAEQSGTAAVRITHNRQPWTGATIRWHEDDLEVVRGAQVPGRRFRVVDDVLYAFGPRGRWVRLGDPKNVDPDTGTTPDEYLVAVREDVGGATLNRIVHGMTDLRTRELPDGSTVYSGSVAAGLIARETGVKEGQRIRVLPFGFVAHDEAANATAPLDVEVTVSPDEAVKQISVTWGTSASAWAYTVTYSKLGDTGPISAPKNARPLRELLRGGDDTGSGGDN
jgi:hypothetical protein